MYYINYMEKSLLSTKEAANYLGVSSVQVFRLIQAGKIKAEKVGNSFVINSAALEDFLIQAPVRRAIKDYGETLRRLGKE